MPYIRIDCAVLVETLIRKSETTADQSFQSEWSMDCATQHTGKQSNQRCNLLLTWAGLPERSKVIKITRSLHYEGYLFLHRVGTQRAHLKSSKPYIEEGFHEGASIGPLFPKLPGRQWKVANRAQFHAHLVNCSKFPNCRQEGLSFLLRIKY
jgi:hypothetical protein